jgi:hypothetical protein
VRHKNDSLGAILDSVFDGVECADDALVVGDVLLGIEGNIEVNLRVASGPNRRGKQCNWKSHLRG